MLACKFSVVAIALKYTIPIYGGYFSGVTIRGFRGWEENHKSLYHCKFQFPTGTNHNIIYRANNQKFSILPLEKYPLSWYNVYIATIHTHQST